MPEAVQQGRARIAVKIIAIIVFGAIVIVSIIRDRIVQVPQWTVSVSGEGRVKYAADLAYVTLGVQVDKATTAQEALNRLNTSIVKAVEAIKRTGIPGEDIQTQNYSLFPQYDYRDSIQTLSGYSANQQLKVTVRGVDRGTDAISAVIAAAANEGVNQVVNLQFSTSKLSELKEQARLMAIADAKSKAGDIAQAAGVKLGDVVGWWENAVGVPMPYYSESAGYGGAGGAASPTIPNGGQEIILEVSLNYKIK